LATGDNGGYFKLWDITSLDKESSSDEMLKEVVFIRAHKSEITCCDFAYLEGNKFLITGSTDKNLHLFTLEGKFSHFTENLKAFM
jgi:WD40 repeat protein